MAILAKHQMRDCFATLAVTLESPLTLTLRQGLY